MPAPHSAFNVTKTAYSLLNDIQFAKGHVFENLVYYQTVRKIPPDSDRGKRLQSQLALGVLIAFSEIFYNIGRLLSMCSVVWFALIFPPAKNFFRVNKRIVNKSTSTNHFLPIDNTPRFLTSNDHLRSSDLPHPIHPPPSSRSVVGHVFHFSALPATQRRQRPATASAASATGSGHKIGNFQCLTWIKKSRQQQNSNYNNNN
ncbi:unnamed protein product [Ceratitis capitata]|uniref:(Mediterranean fruit fly) hypothetical protein n=1 Tax=Ceratitis capitata TaxID=7213 RepID=A0A811V2G9_CERCA|nr:unnamed protein product [Ceratitis capitata]